MRVCSKCGEGKPLDQFSKKSARKDGLQTECKHCHSVYIKFHYERNKQYYVVKARRSKLRQLRINRDYLRTYLLEHPCVDCGEDDPVVLEFDHVRGAKVNSVSALATSLFVPVRRLEAEIAKCEVRCANCHRRRTARVGGYWRIADLPADVKWGIQTSAHEPIEASAHAFCEVRGNPLKGANVRTRIMPQ